MSTSATNQLIYFVSGMWCSTCAKSVRQAVAGLSGVGYADINYASKILYVEAADGAAIDRLDQTIRDKITRIGFAVQRQTDDWIRSFKDDLEREMDTKLSGVRVGIVWFLAMWSSMISFAGYLGQVSAEESYMLALASSAFGLPAILIGIIPYARAGLRALLHSRLPTLDLIIFIGGISAISVSVMSLVSHRAETFADSGSMIIALLLLTKQIENALVKKFTSSLLFQIHPSDSTMVFKKNSWVAAEPSQLRRGDRIRVRNGETIPVDGILLSDKAQCNNHLLTGESNAIALQAGDQLLAGAIAHSDLEVQVIHPLGFRQVDKWAEAALLAKNQHAFYSRMFQRIEAVITVMAFSFPVIAASYRYWTTNRLTETVEAFFVGVLIFCPCLFATIIPLMKRMTFLALSRAGVQISRSEALLELLNIKHFYFDKTGTLEAVESRFEPMKNDATLRALISELAMKCRHPILRGLEEKNAGNGIERFSELAGHGVHAITVNGDTLLVGKPEWIAAQGIMVPTSIDRRIPAVAYEGEFVGQIFVKKIYDQKSMAVLKTLQSLLPDVRVEVLSGDPSPEAERRFSGIINKYRGNLSPEDKAAAVLPKSAYVGDGLNDTLALSQADVSFRIGHRVLGFVPADFQLRLPDLSLIPLIVLYARKYRRVLIQCAVAAVVYNLIAISLAASGRFSPLGAVLAMLTSFSLLTLNALRLLRVPRIHLDIQKEVT